MDEINVKIAESPEEAFWKSLQEKCRKDILSNQREIIINESMIDLCENKISEVNKNGK